MTRRPGPARASRPEVRPLSAGCGAEILGIDLSRPLSRSSFALLRRAYHDHGVIFFRDQDLTPGQHIAFAERWGTININRFFAAVAGHPMIAEVRKEPEQRFNTGGRWHTDHSYDAVPAMGSVLLAREVPPLGGDTLFANMHAAHEALSPGLKRTLAGMKAVHSSRHVFGPQGYTARSDASARYHSPERATQDAVHPVIIRHPDTGRRTLFVNRSFTVRFDGWTEEESRPLLDYLIAHATRPEFTCRFRWAAGSIAFWDNRATMHNAVNDYHGHRRVMHRITIEGVPIS
jgi:taurine dioxygenase